MNCFHLRSGKEILCFLVFESSLAVSDFVTGSHQYVRPQSVSLVGSHILCISHWGACYNRRCLCLLLQSCWLRIPGVGPTNLPILKKPWWVDGPRVSLAPDSILGNATPGKKNSEHRWVVVTYSSRQENLNPNTKLSIPQEKIFLNFTNFAGLCYVSHP